VTPSDSPEASGSVNISEQPRSARSGGWPVRRELVRPVVISAACLVVAAVITVVVIASGHHGAGTTTQASGILAGQVAVPGAQGNGNLNAASAKSAGTPSARPAAAIPASITTQGISKNVVPLPAAQHHAVAAWAAGHGGAALASLTNQLGTVAQLGGEGLYATMRQECGDLLTDAATARASAPIPNTGMQAAYSRSLSQVTSAATSCRAAIKSWAEGSEDIQTHVNQTLLRSSLAGLAAAAHQLYLGTQQIRMLH
jgi:hypothetical protein